MKAGDVLGIEVLDHVVKESGYEEKSSRCSRGRGDRDELYGIGLAMSYTRLAQGMQAAREAVGGVHMDWLISRDEG